MTEYSYHHIFSIKVFLMCTQIHLVFKSCLLHVTKAKQETSRSCTVVAVVRLSNFFVLIFSIAIARRCGKQNESP